MSIAARVTLPTANPDHLLDLFLRQGEEHALILLDADGTVVAWLMGAARLFGYDAGEMHGQRLNRLFLPEDQDRGVPQHELQVARLNGRGEDDRWQLRKDGSRLWASGVVIPLRNEAGEALGFAKILRDRTDVKARIDELAHRLSALHAADRRKNVFLATLAHELRNPLAPLTNALELIRLAGPLDSGLQYPVKLIERQVEFIRRLVDDLGDVARVNAGKLALQRLELDLNQVLGRVAEATRPLFDARRQTFRPVLLPVPLTIDGDPDRLQQVFVNLLTNAAKYTPEGGHVWLTATAEGDEAVVRVEDDGMGISTDMQPRIFELFTQEERSLTRSEGGLGLGLPLVRQLVSLHGGSVQVRSDGPGQGSEFSVRLPLIKANRSA